MAEIAYIGDELELFSHAHGWKSYYASKLAPYIAGRVLEVGAGIGGTTPALCRNAVESWVCLEPDPKLGATLEASLRDESLPVRPTARIGTVQDLEAELLFDCILYIDVLEHIEQDRRELQAAAAHLRADGRLIVLSPAHQFLFSPFDAAIGHFRRYNRASLAAAGPSSLELERVFYLDSLGMLLSLANRLLLRETSPTPAQIRFWDRVVVPCSRVIDPLAANRFGKTIIGIWRLR